MTSSTHHPRETSFFDLLNAQGILHETREHPAIFTVEEGKDLKVTLPGGQTKNLFLKDKTGQYVLICALAKTVIRLNKLPKVLGTKRLSFGTEEALWECLSVRPGSVTLYAIFNDINNKVRLVLDKALFEHGQVWFHPLRNTASTAISSQDVLRFCNAAHHTPTILNFEALAESQAPFS